MNTASLFSGDSDASGRNASSPLDGFNLVVSLRITLKRVEFWVSSVLTSGVCWFSMLGVWTEDWAALPGVSVDCCFDMLAICKVDCV